MQARALLPDSSSLSCDGVTWESDREPDAT